MTTAERTVRLGITGGAVLVVLGIVAYVLTDFASATALIPSFFGFAFVALGLVGRDAARERLAVYGLAALSLVGIAGSTRGLTNLLALVTGGSVELPVAAVSQGVMTLVCLAVLVAALGYIIEERRR